MISFVCSSDKIMMRFRQVPYDDRSPFGKMIAMGALQVSVRESENGYDVYLDGQEATEQFDKICKANGLTIQYAITSEEQQ